MDVFSVRSLKKLGWLRSLDFVLRDSLEMSIISLVPLETKQASEEWTKNLPKVLDRLATSMPHHSAFNQSHKQRVLFFWQSFSCWFWSIIKTVWQQRLSETAVNWSKHISGTAGVRLLVWWRGFTGCKCNNIIILKGYCHCQYMYTSISVLHHVRNAMTNEARVTEAI